MAGSMDNDNEELPRRDEAIAGGWFGPSAELRDMKVWADVVHPATGVPGRGP